jgi:hypothetical protein
MNVKSQLDLHPDAESLNAFAEQALGERERGEILAHLAGCGRCRQVVFLAQEAAAMELEPEMELVAAAAPAAQSSPEGDAGTGAEEAMVPELAVGVGSGGDAGGGDCGRLCGARAAGGDGSGDGKGGATELGAEWDSCFEARAGFERAGGAGFEEVNSSTGGRPNGAAGREAATTGRGGEAAGAFRWDGVAG